MSKFSYRGTICTLAVIGSIVLGVADPDKYGIAAVSNLSGAIGGYMGLSQAKEEEHV